MNYIKDLEYKKNNVNYGLIEERKLLPIFKNVFSPNICKSKYKYTKFDYYDVENELTYELKSRKINHNLYPTALINKCKLDIYPNLIIIYQYTDGLFYIQYEKQLFNTFKCSETFIHNYSGIQITIEIPYQQLIKFNENDKIELTKLYDNDKYKRIFKNLIEEDERLYNMNKYR